MHRVSFRSLTTVALLASALGFLISSDLPARAQDDRSRVRRDALGDAIESYYGGRAAPEAEVTEARAIVADGAVARRRIAVPDPIEVQTGVEGGNVGYELAITGATSTERGSVLRLAGISYEVSGLAGLRATSGLEVTLSLEAATPDGTARRVIEQRTVRSGSGGRFEIELPTPDLDLASPSLTVRVRRAGAPGRAFALGYGVLTPRQLQLLTDRDRYEPGETVHVWTRMVEARTGHPVGGRPVIVTLHGPDGAELSSTETTTRASGSISVDVPLAETAAPGSYRVTVASDELVTPVVRSVEVFERTLERIMMSIELTTRLVSPGGNVRGTVRVSTPSGTPVRNASVEFYASGDFPTAVTLTTGSDGTAVIDTPAPSYLSGDHQSVSCFARVVHPAYGTAVASAYYTLARTPFIVDATPEAGGLVPELASHLYLSVTDPLGNPVRAGVGLEVRGLGLPNGHASATTDAHGLAVLDVRLPRGAAARMEGGACASVTSTSFEVEVQSTPSVTASVCVPVSLEAEVLIRASDLTGSPGGALEVELFRRPSANGRAVLIEALYEGRSLSFAWADPGDTRARITLPEVIGVIDLRARAVAPETARGAYDAEGETLLGTGTRAQVLVRPDDAFALDVTADRPIHRVRETARIDLSTGVAPRGGGWATLVARDEAQHAGEGDYALEVIGSELRAATRGAIPPADALLVRATLAAGTPMENEVVGAPPIVVEPWDVRGWGSGLEGVLRDPVAMREELMRTGITGPMMMLENIVNESAAWDVEQRNRIIRRGARPDFTPDALQVLEEMGFVSEPITLGGLPMTPAMLHDADSSFSFDAIARRVARNRLVFLTLALSRLGNPDDEAAARASAGQPPERWLSLLVQLGMISQEQLSDPWGRPYVFRRVTGRAPAIAVSERALDFELSSPGPDGVAGNADDVRDPFARAIPTGTPYAVASGEDQLMTMLSRISPGTAVLAAMAQAYSRLGLAADEERRGGVVTATTSESNAPMDAMMAGMMDEGGAGYGRGGGGMAASGSSGPYPAAAMPSRMAAAEAEYAMDSMDERRSREDNDADGIPDSDDRLEEDGRFTSMAAVIREDFPATLHFVGEVALDGNGHTTVEIPLADAITTYRIEAIGWSGSGWTSSGRTTIRVEQEAEIDAPVPEMAIVGDAIRMPVRVVNRSGETLRVRFEVSSEGEVGVTLGAASALEVPAGEARDAILEVQPTRAGTGALVIQCRRDGGDGAALDAVRRPLTVVEDARLVRDVNEVLVESRGELELTVPSDASSRGPAEIRIRVAGAIFGAPAEWGGADAPWASWAIAISGQDLPPALADQLVPWASYERYGDARAFYGRTNLQMALVLGALFDSDRLTDDQASTILRFLSDQLGVGTPSDLYTSYHGGYAPPLTSDEASWVLLALAPALRSTARSDIRADLIAVGEVLARAAGDEGAIPVDQPETFARVAAALALASGALPSSSGADARADEMLRRIERSVISVGELAWLEPDGEDGSIEPRIHPTALLALAYIARHRNGDALPLLRSMADVARGAASWTTQSRALACAAAALVVSGPITGSSALTIDGAPIELSTDSAGGMVATSEALSRPGTHRIVATLAEGAIALLEVHARYAVPWDVRPTNEARMSLEWTGEAGARETRSALSLRIRNRGTRVAVRPVVEIQMPAGTELDEATREGLASITAAPPAMEGNVLRLELLPLAPGASIRIPIRSRWSVGGSLRGLGVSAHDDAESRRGARRSYAVLPSRAVDLPDEGPEPVAEDAVIPGAPTPVPPPIVPMPRPLAEGLR
jgi:hypothetical protein